MQWHLMWFIKIHNAEIFSLFVAVKLKGAGVDNVWIFSLPVIFCPDASFILTLKPNLKKL